MYRLDKGEISPLINALEENKSLWRLNLAQSGLEWSEEDSSGAPLISAMSRARIGAFPEGRAAPIVAPGAEGARPAST